MPSSGKPSGHNYTGESVPVKTLVCTTDIIGVFIVGSGPTRETRMHTIETVYFLQIITFDNFSYFLAFCIVHSDTRTIANEYISM